MKMIKHIVMFKLKDDCPKEKITAARDMALALKNTVPQIKSINVGINSDDAPQDNYTIVLDVDFDSIDDLNAYQKNPNHLEFGKFIKDLRTDRACIDYEY